MTEDWSKLTPLHLGRVAEHLFTLNLLMLGLDVYSSEVDDRGIDLVIRQEPDRYWDVQVKSTRKLNYVFLRKDVTRMRPNLLIGLALFDDGAPPDLYLIPVSRWAEPDGLFVDRTYQGLKSKPEYGLNLGRKRLEALLPYRLETQARILFGAPAGP